MESQSFNFPQATKGYVCVFSQMTEYPHIRVQTVVLMLENKQVLYDAKILIHMNVLLTICSLQPRSHYSVSLNDREPEFISVCNRPTVKPYESLSLCNNNQRKLMKIVVHQLSVEFYKRYPTRVHRYGAVLIIMWLCGCLLFTDVNDNVPFFTSSIYEASVTEGAEIGTLVLQVSANDLDLGLNGKV